MTKLRLATLAGCVVGAAAAVLFTMFAGPQPDAGLAEKATHAPHAANRGGSFVRDWKRALADAAGSDGTLGDDGPLWEVVRRWIGRDGRTVMDAVAALEGRSERKAWALSLWLELAPDEALAWAGGLAVDGAALQVAAIRALAGRDPAVALAAAERLEGAVRLDAAKAALRVWAGVDPTAAWQAAQDVSAALRRWWSPQDQIERLREAYERPLHRRALSMAVLDVWVESALQEPLEASVSTPDANVPPRWATAVLARWAAAAPQDALAWASSLPPDTGGPNPLLRVEALGATLASMAVHWPHLAIQAMEEIGDWRNRDRQRIYSADGYQEVLRRFADTTPARRVAAWFESHPDESMRSFHADEIARAYARAHPDEAVAWARALPLGQRTDAVWAALNVVTGEAPDRIAAMLLDFGDAELLRMSQDRLMAAWAKVDPVATLQWKEVHLPQTKIGDRMATFNVWAVYDPVAAAGHVDNLANPEERAWAAWHVIDGTFTGAMQRGKKDIVEHIPMIERLYADLPPERRSKHVAYFLYRHFEHSDPQRAARYKVEAGDDHGHPWNFN